MRYPFIVSIHKNTGYNKNKQSENFTSSLWDCINQGESRTSEYKLDIIVIQGDICSVVDKEYFIIIIFEQLFKYTII